MLLLALRSLSQNGAARSSAGGLAGEMNGAAGVVKHLHGFEAGEFVEEPAAACVHQHRVALHFEKLQGADVLLAIQFVRCVLGKKCAPPSSASDPG